MIFSQHECILQPCTLALEEDAWQPTSSSPPQQRWWWWWCAHAHTQWKFHGFLVNIIDSFQPQVSSSFCSIFILVFLWLCLPRHHFLNTCPILREPILDGGGQHSAMVHCLHSFRWPNNKLGTTASSYARSQPELKPFCTFFKYGYKLNIKCGMLKWLSVDPYHGN